ncbi:MAG: glycerol-3-phosphate 1-O-acyltransferase PlsY [Alphaproteobacteria bacterium]|nr:glycerol-3-phosphate 1-O-acyltransferase PlsY [Alphaproteobacteria bacterium]
MEKAEFIFFLIALNPIVLGYFIGSIPFGLLLTRLSGLGDIRNIGSGNIGATNVLRTGNKFLALLTLLLDAGKGAALIAAIYFYQGTASFATLPVMLSGCGAILGHCFPVWLKFKGGKGVATTFGVLFAAVPWTGFIAAVTWGIVAGFSRYSSLSALSAVAIAPLVTFIYYGPMPAGITVLIAALVIWRHKDNIKRLMAGTEPKIGDNKNQKPQINTDEHR